jgi:hypothetical protein
MRGAARLEDRRAPKRDPISHIELKKIWHRSVNREKELGARYVSTYDHGTQSPLLGPSLKHHANLFPLDSRGDEVHITSSGQSRVNILQYGSMLRRCSQSVE